MIAKVHKSIFHSISIEENFLEKIEHLKYKKKFSFRVNLIKEKNTELGEYGMSKHFRTSKDKGKKLFQIL